MLFGTFVVFYLTSAFIKIHCYFIWNYRWKDTNYFKLNHFIPPKTDYSQDEFVTKCLGNHRPSKFYEISEVCLSNWRFSNQQSVILHRMLNNGNTCKSTRHLPWWHLMHVDRFNDISFKITQKYNGFNAVLLESWYLADLEIVIFVFCRKELSTYLPLYILRCGRSLT